MGDYVKDILKSLKLSILLFIIGFVLGILIGVILHPKTFTSILLWGCRIVQYISIFGMAIAGISFTKQDLLKPLNYENQWKNYFNKLNLSFVILFMSVFSLILSYLVETIILY
ncbi:hypothetical protein [Clostridium niameyense]|uniref:hypothetical protein n=1 Tax=Clostridium niameyense TaxID=1622073 RepID=UPI000B02F527|nr:hypothetical protein [Clostridium niameyense]